MSKVERGERPLERLSVIEEVARVLDVHPSALVAWRESPIALQRDRDGHLGRDGVQVREVDAIRAVLMRYDGIAAAPGIQEPAVPDLHRGLDRLWAAFQSSRYSLVAADLPELLPAARLAARTLGGDQRLTALDLLATTYQVGAATLLKLGAPELAWLAADRGLAAAEESGNRLTLAGCARVLAHALMDSGHHEGAVELVAAVAGTIEAAAGSGGPELLSVYGSLLLKGAMASARLGDRAAARDLLADAARAADRLGRDANHRWTAFGPANVALHRASSAVALGDGGDAVAHALGVDPSRLVAVERRAQRLIELAGGYGLWAKSGDALEALLQAERLAPEEVRAQPAARLLVGDLLRRQRRRGTGELRALAERISAP